MPELEADLIEKLEALECINTPSPVPEYCLSLPFGLQICTGRASAFFFEGRDTQLLPFMNLLQGLMVPIMMILVLASIAKALIDCVKSIPEAIGSFSPGPIIDCLEKLAKIFPLLTQFIPPLSYIKTIVDIIRIAIALLDSFIESILLTIEAAARLAQFDVDIGILPDLGRYRQCVDSEIDAQYQQLAQSLRTTGPLFGIIAQFLELINLPPLSKFITPLRDAANALANAQAADLEDGSIISSLQDLRKILGDLEIALRPFGGSGESFQ
jgi:hypothetical protein